MTAPLYEHTCELLPAERPGALAHAARLALSGKLIIFPTDTVYGVGTTPFSAEALARLYALKGRELTKGIPVLLADSRAVTRIAAVITPVTQRLIDTFWPGPLTLIMEKRADLPANLTPNNGVAVRVPNHPVARELIALAGGALAATSANPSGEPPALSGTAAFTSFDGRVSVVIDGGPADVGRSSTIVDCRSDRPVLLREGPLTLAQVLSAVKDLL